MSAEVLKLLNAINRVIINPIILLLFAIAFLVFVWGIFQFISSETADAKRKDGQRKILYGILGMFIMISARGLILLVLNTFNLPAPGYPF